MGSWVWLTVGLASTPLRGPERFVYRVNRRLGVLLGWVLIALTLAAPAAAWQQLAALAS